MVAALSVGEDCFDRVLHCCVFAPSVESPDLSEEHPQKSLIGFTESVARRWEVLLRLGWGSLLVASLVSGARILLDSCHGASRVV